VGVAMVSRRPFSVKVNDTVVIDSLTEKNRMARTAKTTIKPSLATLTPPPRKKRPESLTSREKEILELIWAGFNNKEIGQQLKINPRTVGTHRAHLRKKMRVSNTAQLLKTAIQDGTITIR
jgi:DNA-binding NarL/FixJ family response regulator